MLSYFHQTIGFLVVVSNMIAAVWIGLLAYWGREIERGALWTLWVARGTLALQVLLGVTLIGDGAVGRTGHYLFAMIAVVAAWFTYTTSRRPGTDQKRTLAIGCAAVGICALGASLRGR